MRKTLLLLVLATLAASAAAKDEFYIGPVFTPGKSYSQEGGTSVRTDTGYGLNLGFSHEFTRQWEGGGEMTWSNTDYRATVAPAPGNSNGPTEIRGTIESWTLRFFGTYYFTTSRLKPFASFGAGWTYVDTNIPTGLPQNACWWYPWYGYVCSAYVPTAATTRFSYNGALGLRYDFPGNTFVRGVFNAQSIDYGGANGSDYITQYRIDVGWRF
jgi:opacity protein-like surface antigen